MKHSINFPSDWKDPASPGFGTFPGPYRYQNLPSYYKAVQQAIEQKYRHIDHAQTYMNDSYIGKAIAESGIRDDLFVTSKLNPDNNSYHGALNGIQQILNNTGLSYLDMYLIHYPGSGDPYEAWKGILESRENNLCRHCGVSNFEINHLEKLCEIYGHYPEVNQIEFHPLLYSPHLQNLVDFCHENGILVEGYCPLGQNDIQLMGSHAIKSIASEHQRSKSQVVLKWSMQHGVRPVVGTTDPLHMSDNFGPYDFILSDEEMKEINALSINKRISLEWGWDPTNCYG